MLIIYGTSQTWAYLNGQLDFSRSRQVRAHAFLEGTDKSLCGLHLANGWECEVIEADDYLLYGWKCAKCAKRLEQLITQGMKHA